MNDLTDPYLTVEELLARISSHDYLSQEWEILVIVSELAKAGRVRSIGRRCDHADQPGDQWELIPSYERADLVIHLRPRAQPHPGDVFWRSSGRRAWAFVQFCDEDLVREWLAEIFARPRREAPADIIVPPIKRTNPPDPGGGAAAEASEAAATAPEPPPEPTNVAVLVAYLNSTRPRNRKHSFRDFWRVHIREELRLTRRPGFEEKTLRDLWVEYERLLAASTFPLQRQWAVSDFPERRDEPGNKPNPKLS
jgi:hypothetical protein